jgi:hypothetical protein
MTNQHTHRATPEQWEYQERWASDDDDASCILELRCRVEALEADQLEQAESNRFCTDAIVRRVEALEATQHAHADVSHLSDAEREQVTQESAMTELPAARAEARHGVVERDPECVANWPDCYEGGYDPSCCRFPKSCSCEVGNSSAGLTSSPGGLVERVAKEIASAGGFGGSREARAAIREVAAWLRRTFPEMRTTPQGVATTLEDEICG